MRRILFFGIYFLSFYQLFSQFNEFPADTFYSGKELPAAFSSIIPFINKGLGNLCRDKIKIESDDIYDNRRYNFMVSMRTLDEKSKTEYFTGANITFVSYYCERMDVIDDILLIEFVYMDSKTALKAYNALKKVYQDKMFWEIVGTKNWYFVTVNNKLILLDARMKDEYNPMKVQIEQRIKQLLE